MSSDLLPDGFRAALLFEFDIAEQQILGLANEIPADKFDWRPGVDTRSVSEVVVHVAVGNLSLLTIAGKLPPPDIYGPIYAEGDERLWAVVRRNDELEKAIREKAEVLNLLKRALQICRESIASTDERTLEEPLSRRTYMRMIAHSHEHMGQLIAYARMVGVVPPWSQ